MGMLTESQLAQIERVFERKIEAYLKQGFFPGLPGGGGPTSGPAAGIAQPGSIAVFADATGKILATRSLVVEDDGATLTLLSALALSLSTPSSFVQAFPDGHIELRTTSSSPVKFGFDGNFEVLITPAGISLAIAGAKFSIKEGSNASMGEATLSGGVIVVPTTLVTANSRIFISAKNSSANAGFLDSNTRTPGTSFTITSSNVLDDRKVDWLLVEPA